MSKKKQRKSGGRYTPPLGASIEVTWLVPATGAAFLEFLNRPSGPIPADLPHCAGTELEHRDGTMTCSLGEECAGPDVEHLSGHNCNLFARCERCGAAPLFRA